MPIPRAVYKELHLVPSILSADFSRLGEEITKVMEAGALMIHVDVMDGHFVPNLTIGPVVVEAVAPLVHEQGGLVTVHLMIERPEDYLERFVQAGADAISLHVEACRHLHQAVRSVQDLGAGAGLAINPGTDMARLGDLLGLVDYVLVMTVNPGFGGQDMIASALAKVPVLRQKLPADVAIEVDGGVGPENIKAVLAAGANWLVAGSAVFHAADPAAETRRLRQLMKE